MDLDLLPRLELQTLVVRLKEEKDRFKTLLGVSQTELVDTIQQARAEREVSEVHVQELRAETQRQQALLQREKARYDALAGSYEDEMALRSNMQAGMNALRQEVEALRLKGDASPATAQSAEEASQSVRVSPEESSQSHLLKLTSQQLRTSRQKHSALLEAMDADMELRRGLEKKVGCLERHTKDMETHTRSLEMQCSTLEGQLEETKKQCDLEVRAAQRKVAEADARAEQQVQRLTEENRKLRTTNRVLASSNQRCTQERVDELERELELVKQETSWQKAKYFENEAKVMRDERDRATKDLAFLREWCQSVPELSSGDPPEEEGFSPAWS